MKKKPFTYIIECGDYDSFSSVCFAMREEVKYNAALIKIKKESHEIYTKEKVNRQIKKSRAFF